RSSSGSREILSIVGLCCYRAGSSIDLDQGGDAQDAPRSGEPWRRSGEDVRYGLFLPNSASRPKYVGDICVFLVRDVLITVHHPQSPSARPFKSPASSGGLRAQVRARDT